MVRAILAKHNPDVEAECHGMLDELEARSGVTAREWVQALVLPAAAKLADRDGGREYLRIMAELMNRPDPKFDRQLLEDTRSSVHRWRKLMAPLMPELSVNRLHRRFTALRIMHFELARRTGASDALLTLVLDVGFPPGSLARKTYLHNPPRARRAHTNLPACIVRADRLESAPPGRHQVYGPPIGLLACPGCDAVLLKGNGFQ